MHASAILPAAANRWNELRGSLLERWIRNRRELKRFMDQYLLSMLKRPSLKTGEVH